MDRALIEGVSSAVRELAATAKALRLYPPTSPIPHQSAESAAAALDDLFGAVPVLSLTVTKEGFAFAGAPVQLATATELSAMLQNHGAAEVSFTPGCDAQQVLGFLTLVNREPEDVRAEGGPGALLAAAGVQCVSISDVHLTVIDGIVPEEDGDVDEFLRALAQDPDKLTTWLSSASAGDPATLRDSLLELARSVGPGGTAGLLDALSSAFMSQKGDGRDVLLGLAMEPGPVRDLTGDMFSRLGAQDVATSVVDGRYGKNMLSLSTALTALPISDRFTSIMDQVQELLPSYGHGGKELEFLTHMVDARQSLAAETPVTDADPDYARVVEETSVTDTEVASALDEVGRSDIVIRQRAIATLLTLLDQQKDFGLYCQTLESLSRTIPRLIESGDLSLARRALSEIAGRETRSDLPWPELADRLRDARAKATGGKAMAHVLSAVARDANVVADAKEILQVAGDLAPQALVEAALSAKDFDGLSVAGAVLGRRMLDLLPATAPKVQWYQVATLVARLADQGDPRSQQAIATLTGHDDHQTRREAAKGLGASANPVVVGPLSDLLRDGSAEVAITAARALASSGASGAAAAVVERLDELDVDTKDFTVARELIGTLARMREPAAHDALHHLAHRRALIKRGHFAEIQDLARRALEAQEGGAGR